MIDIENYIARRYRERVFAELTPTDFNEILLDQIDELHSPIKIGPLEFKASEIIKQLRPDALENYEIKSELLGAEGRKNFDWYTSILENNEYSYCWLENPDSNFAADFNFFKYEDCHRIMKEVKDDFLQQFKNDLLQENKDLLQKVMKELLGGKKFDNPIEIEIYSEDKSGRKFLNSNGEQSFRAVVIPEPSVIPEPQVVEANVHLEVAKDLEDKKGKKINYDTFFCAASKGDLEVVKYLVEIIEKDNPIAIWMDIKRDDDESSYAVWEAASNGHLEVVKYLVGEKGAYIGISTAFYAGTNGHLEVLKYLLDEKSAKIDDIKEAVKHCIEHGHLEVVKYLVEKLPAQAPAQATSMSDKRKQKDVIKSTFLTLVYTLEEIIEYDQENDKYFWVGSLFDADRILQSINDLMETFPELTEDLALQEYDALKSYMDEYSKYRKEKQEKEKPRV